MLRIAAIVAARGGSSRCPDKNLAVIHGTPCVEWVIRACHECRYVMDVWVSSDSPAILLHAERCGARPYPRRLDLARDCVDKMVVIRDCAEYIHAYSSGADIGISLQANSPQLRGAHLTGAIEMLLRHNLQEVLSVNPDGVQNAAFRVMRWDYLRTWTGLSSHCGAYICTPPLIDIHTHEDLQRAAKEWPDEDCSRPVEPVPRRADGTAAHDPVRVDGRRGCRQDATVRQ